LALAIIAGQGAATAQTPPAVLGTPRSAEQAEIDELKTRLQRLEQREHEQTLPPPNQPNSTASDQQVSCSPESSSIPKLFASWQSGLILESADGDFRVHVGDQLQVDVGWWSASQALQFGPGGTGELPDGAQLRRAAIRVEGTMYRNVEWVLNVNFTGSFDNDSGPSVNPVGTINFDETYIGLRDIPCLDTLRAGYLKEPFGFNHLVSSRWLNFMERQPGGDFSNLISPGIEVLNVAPNERGTWAIGLFHPTNNNFGFGSGDGQLAVTGRLTWLPIYECDGRELLHLGAAATVRDVPDDQINLRGRPDVRTAPSTSQPSLAETGTIDVRGEQAFDLELVAVHGSWTLQSEYYATFLHDAVFPAEAPPAGIPRGTLFYQGCYVEVLYFLTGEHQPYDRQSGVFTRVVPLSNFGYGENHWGCGAWQAGVRYTYLDLQNHGVDGATLNDVTLGLNWILNPNTRVQWNLGIDHRSPTPPGSEGWSYVFGMRFGIDF
jgi:phosphate-selective porin OprO/OprP